MERDSLFTGADGRLRPAWRFGVSVVMFLAAGMAASGASSLLARGRPAASAALYTTLLFILLTAGYSAMLYALDWVRSSPLAAMGLAWRRPALADSLWGIGFGAGLVTLVVVTIALLGDLHLTVRASLPHALKVLTVEAWILAASAMTEEMAFRGYPLQRLLEALGTPAAVGVLSFLFGLVHLRNPHSSVYAFLNTMLIGVLFCVAYLRTRSLWLPWGIHLGWNFTLAVVYGLPMSGYSDLGVVVQGTARGPRWLTGGPYGIEASAVGTVVVVLGTLLLPWLFRARPAPEVVLAGHAARSTLGLLDKPDDDPTQTP